ncbi:MAG: hypothetical protein KBT68_08495, partial [bacterium]|nr:hypothetical protein [Candidatus Colisoma equi]
FPAEALDAGLQRSNAESKRRAEFAALFDKGAAGVKDGKLDMDTIRWFLGDVAARLDAGVVYNYDSPIWDTIGKALSFDMEYFFSYVDRPEGREPDLERDLCGETGWLGEEKDQQEIHAALKRVLISAGALAQRIGSSHMTVGGSCSSSGSSARERERITLNRRRSSFLSATNAPNSTSCSGRTMRFSGGIRQRTQPPILPKRALKNAVCEGVCARNWVKC